MQPEDPAVSDALHTVEVISLDLTDPPASWQARVPVPTLAVHVSGWVEGGFRDPELVDGMYVRVLTD